MSGVSRYFWMMCLLDSFRKEPLCSPNRDEEWQTYGNQLTNKYNGELSVDSKPVEYWLKVTPNFENETFKGDVTVEIMVNSNTNTIELNCEQLMVENVTVSDDRDARKQKATFKLNTKENILEIQTPKRLKAYSRYKINVKFTGYLYRNNPFGLALYTHHNQDDNREWENALMAETLFQPFSARKVFPCYDELRYRTPFTLIVVVRNNADMVVSNLSANATIDSDKDGNQNVTFKTAEPIPISAVYFAIFLRGYRSVNKQGKYFVWTIEKYANQVSYAVQDLEQIVEKIGPLFSQENTTSDLPRVDLVVPFPEHINNQLEFLRYVKKNMLCDARYCSQNYQQEVTRNIVRQVWNKWLNQYVSVRFWSHLWLINGFGVYYEFKLADTIKSHWRMADLHGSTILQSTLYDDLRTFHHPLTRNFPTEKKVFQMIHSSPTFTFYNNKASLIVRMLEHIVGESTFKKAMLWFLSIGRLQDGLISPADLWKEIQSHIHLEGRELGLPKSRTLSDVMDLYARQTGYPLITVRHVSEGKLARIIVNQEPYVFSTNNAGERIGSKWIVPVTIATRNNANFLKTTPIAWSVANKETIVPIQIEEDEWYIFNVQNIAYCRTNYPVENWLRLIDQLKRDPKKIHPLNRIQLIADSHVLAMDAKLDVSIPIKLTAYLTKEDDPAVWLIALDQFKRFYATLDKNLRPFYEKFFRDYLKHEYRRTGGFQIGRNDDHVTRVWKSEMLNFLCWIGDEECVLEAGKVYGDSENKLSNIDPDLQYAVICTMRREAKLQIPLTKIETDDQFCSREIIRNGALCQYTRWNSESPLENSNEYDRLLTRVINGNQRAEKLVDGILMLWDTLLPLLETVNRTILTWCQAHQQPATHACNDRDVENMAWFVQNFRGKITGDAEIGTFIDITKNVARLSKFNSGKYAPLVEAVDSVAHVTATRYTCVDENQFLSLLESNKYSSNTTDPTVVPKVETRPSGGHPSGRKMRADEDGRASSSSAPQPESVGKPVLPVRDPKPVGELIPPVRGSEPVDKPISPAQDAESVNKPIPPVRNPESALVKNNRKNAGSQFPDWSRKCEASSSKGNQRQRLSDSARIIESMMPFGRPILNFPLHDSSSSDEMPKRRPRRVRYRYTRTVTKTCSCADSTSSSSSAGSTDCDCSPSSTDSESSISSIDSVSSISSISSLE